MTLADPSGLGLSEPSPKVEESRKGGVLHQGREDSGTENPTIL